MCLDRHQKLKQTDNLGNKNKSGQFEFPFGFSLMTGCRRTRLFLNSIIERLVAAIFLLISSPLFIVIPVIIKLQDGGPVFYISRRMGKDKQLFNMYKFRSLAPRAEQIIGAQALHHSHAAEIPGGRFLRDTRVDEIPQLFNVILGHMQFWGPRPERPSLYAEQCAHIPGYDRRFAVKPGLFGKSQIFTPSTTTPRRMRALIDYRFINRRKRMGCVRTAWTMFLLLLRMVRKGLRVVKARLLLKLRMSRTLDRRALERIRQGGHALEIDGDDSTGANNFRLIDINDDCIYLHTKDRLPDTPLGLRLKIKKDAWLPHRVKIKTARVIGNIFRQRQIDNDPYKNSYVISYSAYSPLNRYLIDKYLLKKSIL